MAPRLQQLVEQAWPVLEAWAKAQLDDAQAKFGIDKVIPARSASTLVKGLLPYGTSEVDDLLRRRLGAAEVSTYQKVTPRFSRIRWTLPVGGGASDVDALQQIAWGGSERHQARLAEWVNSVVAAESCYAWLSLGTAPTPLPGEAEVIDAAGSSASLPRIEAQTPGRPIDAAALQTCRKKLDAGARQPLWVLVSGKLPELDAEAKDELCDGIMTSVPAALIPPRYVFVVAPRTFDAVLLRDSPLALTWDYSARGIDSSAGGVDLVLEQLLAVEVMRPPPAVWFVSAKVRWA
jgi:hypothetical protein